MNGSGAVLMALTKQLSIQWQQTRSQWSDAKSQEFERKFMVELVTSVDKAALALEDLEKLIRKIRSECEY